MYLHSRFTFKKDSGLLQACSSIHSQAVHWKTSLFVSLQCIVSKSDKEVTRGRKTDDYLGRHLIQQLLSSRSGPSACCEEHSTIAEVVQEDPGPWWSVCVWLTDLPDVDGADAVDPFPAFFLRNSSSCAAQTVLTRKYSKYRSLSW